MEVSVFFAEFGNVEFLIGDASGLSGTVLDTSGYTLCHQYTTTAGLGESIEIFCDQPVKGRYLVIKKLGAVSSEIAICDIRVLVAHGRSVYRLNFIYTL